MRSHWKVVPAIVWQFVPKATLDDSFKILIQQLWRTHGRASTVKFLNFIFFNLNYIFIKTALYPNVLVHMMNIINLTKIAPTTVKPPRVGVQLLQRSTLHLCLCAWSCYMHSGKMMIGWLHCVSQSALKGYARLWLAGRLTERRVHTKRTEPRVLTWVNCYLFLGLLSENELFSDGMK